MKEIRLMLALLMALAAVPVMLTACGDKQANKMQGNESEAFAAVEDSVSGYDSADDSLYLKKGQMDGIRRVWASNPLTGVSTDGVPDIERFALAFCMAYPGYAPNKALSDYLECPTKFHSQDFRVDVQQKNGYILCQGQFQMSWDTSCCYWKRKNGHCLVAFWLEEGYEGDQPTDVLLAFYDYDPATDSMTPEPALCKKITDAMAAYDMFSVVLPSEGKDIEVIGHQINEEEDNCVNTYYIGVWNGHDFDLEEVGE